MIELFCSLLAACSHLGALIPIKVTRDRKYTRYIQHRFRNVSFASRRMSLFGSFSSRRTSKDSTARTVVDVGDLPNFVLAELVNKDEIGRGGFATVFTVEFPCGGEKVVVKKFLLNEDEEETRRLVLKEAKLLKHSEIQGNLQ